MAEKSPVDHPNDLEDKASRVPRRLRYSDGVDIVVLEVPWGPHSDNIPPPVVAFGARLFKYQAEEDEYYETFLADLRIRDNTESPS